MIPGPRNLITDVPGLRVGNAQDLALNSGVTVLTADQPFLAAAHVMGGAPGTRETDLLEPDKPVEDVDAIFLSGGSAFGLDAASGIMQALRQAGRGLPVGGARVPIVPGAILFDLLNGGRKDWVQSPYPDLGAAALQAASEGFHLGTTGAGTGALSANLKGGLGSASFLLPTGHMVGALVAANPMGDLTNPGNRTFWAAPFEQGAEFGGLVADGSGGHGLPQPSQKRALTLSSGDQGNTTLAIVATDAFLTKAQAKRLAMAAHDGMARAIFPSHQPGDGDIVFAVSTRARALDTPALALSLLGHAAGLCVARAAARAIYCATPQPGDLLPCWSSLNTQ